jgi:hypothetical protein
MPLRTYKGMVDYVMLHNVNMIKQSTRNLLKHMVHVWLLAPAGQANFMPCPAILALIWFRAKVWPGQTKFGSANAEYTQRGRDGGREGGREGEIDRWQLQGGGLLAAFWLGRLAAMS